MRQNAIEAPYVWGEVYGNPARLHDLTLRLSVYACEPTVKLWCKLLFLLQNDPNTEATARRSFFGTQLGLRLDDLDKRRGSPGRVLSRLQLLNLVKWTLLVAAGERTIETQEQFQEAGELLLLASDLVDKVDEIDWDEDTDLIDKPSKTLKRVAARYLIENADHPLASFSRWYYLLQERMPEHIGQGDKRRGLQILDALFFRATGAHMADYVLLSFVLGIQESQYKIGDFFKRQPGIQEQALRKSFAWTPERFEATARALSLDRDDLVNDMLESQALPFSKDFGTFRRHPFYRTESGYLTIDPGMLAYSYGEQVLRHIESTDKARQKPIRDALGRSFEDYVQELFATARRDYNDKVRKAPDTKGKQADIVIEEGSARIVCEIAKASFGDDARFSNDPVPLTQALERLSKEYSQIVRSVEHELRSAEVRRVIPVLIGMDKMLSLHGIQRTLNKKFEAELGSVCGADETSHFRVTRLITMSIDDAEELAALVHQGYSFRDLLEAVLAEDPKGMSPVQNVWAARGYVRGSVAPLIDRVSAEYRSIVVNQELAND